MPTILLFTQPKRGWQCVYTLGEQEFQYDRVATTKTLVFIVGTVEVTILRFGKKCLGCFHGTGSHTCVPGTCDAK